MDGDLELAAYNAAAFLNATTFAVRAEYREYSGLKAEAEFVRGENALVLKASDGFKAAPQDALTGLALSLFSRILRRPVSQAHAPFVRAYEEFNSRRSTARLSNSLRRLHGRRSEEHAEGTHYDLKQLQTEVLAEYPETFAGMKTPSISWSRHKSKRRLGYHDSAFEHVVISRAFDSPRAPRDVVKYLVYHELLHQKHDVHYQRGASLRRTVHPHAFKQDERRFPNYEQIDAWIERSVRWL